MMNRRSFFTSTACLGATLATGIQTASAGPDESSHKKRIKLGIATYSYWHFRDPKVSIERVIDKAAEIGVEGVDILHRQMDIPEKEPLTAAHRSYLQKLKRHAFHNGIAPVCLSIHQNFVQQDPTERQDCL
jgi:L-ribulose-5-phosphate 3-epimerase